MGPFPTVEKVGYYRSPLRGLRGECLWWCVDLEDDVVPPLRGFGVGVGPFPTVETVGYYGLPLRGGQGQAPLAFCEPNGPCSSAPLGLC